MALLQEKVSSEICDAYIEEMGDVATYLDLLKILHSISFDDCYTIENMVHDLQNVTTELRGRIVERELPVVTSATEGGVSVG